METKVDSSGKRPQIAYNIDAFNLPFYAHSSHETVLALGELLLRETVNSEKQRLI